MLALNHKITYNVRSICLTVGEQTSIKTDVTTSENELNFLTRILIANLGPSSVSCDLDGSFWNALKPFSAYWADPLRPSDHGSCVAVGSLFGHHFLLCLPLSSVHGRRKLDEVSVRENGFCQVRRSRPDGRLSSSIVRCETTIKWRRIFYVPSCVAGVVHVYISSSAVETHSNPEGS